MVISSTAGALRPHLTQAEIGRALKLRWAAARRLLESHGIHIVETGDRSWRAPQDEVLALVNGEQPTEDAER